MRVCLPRLSVRGVCKLTIDKTRMPRTYKMMVAESPTNFQPLNIINHYCAVLIVLWSGIWDKEKVFRFKLEADKYLNSFNLKYLHFHPRGDRKWKCFQKIFSSQLFLFHFQHFCFRLHFSKAFFHILCLRKVFCVVNFSLLDNFIMFSVS